MLLPFKIAVRFLKSNKGQTILIVLGIAVGVSVQVFIGSLIQGLQKSLVNKTIGSTSQVTITSNVENKNIEDWVDKVTIAESSDNRIDKISPVVDKSGFIKFNSTTLPVLVRGFELDSADKIYDITSNLIDGVMPKTSGEIVIGSELKDKLSVRLGDSVTIITPEGSKQHVLICGFFNFKVANMNKSWVITNMETAQSIFGLRDDITSIEMQIKDVFKAGEIAREVKNKLEDKDLRVDNWEGQNEQLLSALKGQSISSIMIQVFVLISVILGIASVLAISVMQKSKQIGILKAMGIKNSGASLIFLFEGLILGILGSAFGILLGLALSYAFTKFALNSDGTPVIPLYISYKFIIASGIIAVMSASLASIIPARKSSKLSPVEVINND